MLPLFDVDAFARADDDAARADLQRPPEKPVAIVLKPVDYWVRGIFKHGDGQQTRTVRAVGMSARLDADVARFVHYLTDAGFPFAEGRGYLLELLGVGADDGVSISFGGERADAEGRRCAPVVASAVRMGGDDGTITATRAVESWTADLAVSRRARARHPRPPRDGARLDQCRHQRPCPCCPPCHAARPFRELSPGRVTHDARTPNAPHRGVQRETGIFRRRLGRRVFGSGQGMPRGERRGPYPTTYQPLIGYLAAQTGRDVTLSFADIEAIIAARLSVSACGMPAFWNVMMNQPQVRHQWEAMGWRACYDRRTQSVHFTRDEE